MPPACDNDSFSPHRLKYFNNPPVHPPPIQPPLTTKVVTTRLFYIYMCVCIYMCVSVTCLLYVCNTTGYMAVTLLGIYVCNTTGYMSVTLLGICL